MFENIFSTKKRIGRIEFGISIIIYFVGASFLTAALNSNGLEFLVIAFPFLLWFIIAQGAKRCHDLNRSGLFQFIPFYFLWMIFAKGDEIQNKYGEKQTYNKIKQKLESTSIFLKDIFIYIFYAILAISAFAVAIVAIIAIHITVMTLFKLAMIVGVIAIIVIGILRLFKIID